MVCACRESNPNLQLHMLVCLPLQHKHRVWHNMELPSCKHWRESGEPQPQCANKTLEAISKLINLAGVAMC